MVSALSKCRFSYNSYLSLDIYIGPLVTVPVGGIRSLIDIWTSYGFLMRGSRSTPFLYFSTTYCSTISCKFCKLSLKFSSLVPSTAPNSGTLPLKVFGIPAFVLFLVKFLFLLPLLALYYPAPVYCYFSLRAWTCGSLVSPTPFYWM